MTLASKVVLGLGIVCMAAGCAKSPPKCSDEATGQLVRQLVLEQVGGQQMAMDDAAKKLLSFEYARASAYDEKIQKVTCEAKLVAGSTYQVPIRYESQLDDRGEHIVSLEPMLPGDIEGVRSAVIAKVPAGKDDSGNGKNPVLTQDISTLGNDSGAPDNLTGLWKGKLEGDGEMKINKAGQDYQVVVGVSSPDGCSGAASGSATLVGDVLTMQDNSDGESCKISIKIQGKSAELEEEGCTSFHGAACSFFGTLTKVK